MSATERGGVRTARPGDNGRGRTRSTLVQEPSSTFQSHAADVAVQVKARRRDSEPQTYVTGCLWARTRVLRPEGTSQTRAVESSEPVTSSSPSLLSHPRLTDAVWPENTGPGERVMTFQARAVWSFDSVTSTSPRCRPWWTLSAGHNHTHTQNDLRWTACADRRSREEQAALRFHAIT